MRSSFSKENRLFSFKQPPLLFFSANYQSGKSWEEESPLDSRSTQEEAFAQNEKLLFRTRAFHLRPKNCTFNVPQRFRDRLAIFLVTVCGRSICYYFGTASNRERPTLIDRPNSMLAYFFISPFDRSSSTSLSRVVRRRLGVDVNGVQSEPVRSETAGRSVSAGPESEPLCLPVGSTERSTLTDVTYFSCEATLLLGSSIRIVSSLLVVIN